VRSPLTEVPIFAGCFLTRVARVLDCDIQSEGICSHFGRAAANIGLNSSGEKSVSQTSSPSHAPWNRTTNRCSRIGSMRVFTSSILQQSGRYSMSQFYILLLSNPIRVI